MKSTKIWFLSDPHFGHKNIIKYEGEKRPFNDTEEMDNVIIGNYNQTVGENDIVFWLGDMFFCNTKRMKYIASRLKNGRKIVIRGNHDKGISNTKFKRLGFMPYKMYQFGASILTHEPISEHNLAILSDYGVVRNIHGHTHSNFTGLDPTKYQCVSLELIDFKPIIFSDLMSRFG